MQAEYDQFTEQQCCLKEAGGEKDILVYSSGEPTSISNPHTPRSPQAKSFGGTIGGTNQNPTR